MTVGRHGGHCWCPMVISQMVNFFNLQLPSLKKYSCCAQIVVKPYSISTEPLVQIHFKVYAPHINVLSCSVLNGLKWSIKHC